MERRAVASVVPGRATPGVLEFVGGPFDGECCPLPEAPGLTADAILAVLVAVGVQVIDGAWAAPVSMGLGVVYRIDGASGRLPVRPFDVYTRCRVGHLHHKQRIDAGD